VDQTLESRGSLVIGITTAVYKQEHSHAGSQIEDQQIVDNIERIYICSAKSIAIYFEKKELLWWLGSCAECGIHHKPELSRT
jgi:hypothetical protein